MRKSIRYILHSLNLASYPEFCNQAPVVTKTKQERKKKTDEGEVGEHARRTTVTEDKMEQHSGTVEWKDTTTSIGKDDTRSGHYTGIDDDVLSLDKYLKLNEDNYKILKLIWADGISADNAGSDKRIKDLKGVGDTMRKLYWSAFNLSHTMNKQKRGEATV